MYDRHLVYKRHQTVPDSAETERRVVVDSALVFLVGQYGDRSFRHEISL